MSNIDGDFERLGRSTSIARGLGVGSVVSVPFATLGCPVSVIFWREVGHEYLAKTTRDYSLI